MANLDDLGFGDEYLGIALSAQSMKKISCNLLKFKNSLLNALKM